MADFTDSKDALGEILPTGAIEHTWEYCSPLVTPEVLWALHLFGIPKVASVIDPVTRKYDVMTPELIKLYIDEAVSICELETGIDIFPKQYREKHAFDKSLYDSFGHMVLRHRPVSSIQSLTVTPSNQQNVYSVPLDWVDVGYLPMGQINLIPLTIALKTGTTVPLNTTAGGATFLSIFGHRPWISSFWQWDYVSGFPNGQIPKVVNQLIGVTAAMEILSMMATTFARNTGQSLSIDGMSQSNSSPGPEIYETRLRHLGEKRKFLVNKIKKSFALGMFVDNV